MVKLTKNNGYTVLSSEGLVFDKKTGSLKKKDKPQTGREEKEKKKKSAPRTISGPEIKRRPRTPGYKGGGMAGMRRFNRGGKV